MNAVFRLGSAWAGRVGWGLLSGLLLSVGAAPPAVPSLRVEPVLGTNAVLLRLAESSPVPLTNFVLEATDSLVAPTYWTEVPATVGTNTVTVAVAATDEPDAAAFFRLRLADAWLAEMDSDADGLSDLFEARHPQFLSPENPADAAADWDRDGQSNGTEAAAGSDPDDFGGQLALAANRRVARKADGSLWTWRSPDAETPERLPLAGAWRQVAASPTHTLAVSADGELWAWGENSGGELGDGTRVAATAPRRVGTETNWAQVAAGRGIFAGFSVGLKRDGSLWQWGEGLSTTMSDPAVPPAPPRPVGADLDWRSVSAGPEHVVALKQDGTLWQWGLNYLGAFGPVDTSPAVLPEPTQVGNGREWRHVSAGGSFTLAIRRDGTLWGWGTLPLPFVPEPTAQPVVLGAGWRWRSAVILEEALLAIREDGTLWAWGNLPAATGSIRRVDRPQPLAPGARWQTVAAELRGFTSAGAGALARRDDGTLWRISLREGGPRRRLQPWRVGRDQDWRSVSAGPAWSLGLKQDGSLWTWGASPYFSTNQPLPESAATLRPVEPGTRWWHVSAGPGRAFGAQLDGRMWHWGRTLRYFGGAWVGGGTLGGGNEHGAGGMGTWVPAESPAPVSTPQPYGQAVPWAQVAQGEDHAVGIRSDGSLWHWGLFPRPAKDTVETRQQANTPVRIGTHSFWHEVRAGGQHCLALTASGTLWAWGYNPAGQLGDGTLVSRTEPVRIGAEAGWLTVAAGASHSLGVAWDGTLWSWGSNAHQQLGVPDLARSAQPVQVGPAADWLAVFAGGESSFAVKRDGTLWAWGRNDEGQLGVGDTSSRSVPTRVAGGTGWRQVSASRAHTLAVRTDGSLWAWGSCQAGQVPDDGLVIEPARVDAGTDW